MTEYELASLLRETAAAISQEFEFFITASFGVILVGYFAGERLKLGPRIVISVLYAGAVALFLMRYQNFADQVRFITSSLDALGSNFPLPENVEKSIWIRRLIVLLGAGAAAYSVFVPALKAGGDDAETDT